MESNLEFEVKNLEDNSSAKYRFVVQKFNMDNVEYDAYEVMSTFNFEVIAKLVQMKSGIIERYEDEQAPG